ncbi:myocardin-related transcription factor B isoform X2 [Oryzias melastigma]|uniref:Myocardin related transcription factor Bb n=1 Tax=Oryzias melastigma TaxID=30732 RepID=A0A3B3B4G2_ORYME|nr:myocardin-related transcription factor B isoform X2 [Oryzias melastigma]
MGLQTWPPSKPPLPSMACLDVETPSICRVLQLCLQQRRSREQLVEQGIMPPLKSPAAFHEQIRNLERARTGNFLKHKLCSRPERSELVRMHILQETQAEPSLQATQMKLKRARLADDLNEKIAKRPGPLELVEKKILPVDSGVEELINGDEAECSQTLPASDVYSFDEDSGDAASPLQSNSQQSPRSHASPSESGGAEPAAVLKTPTQQTLSPKATTDVVNLASTKQQSNQQPRLSNTNSVPNSPSGPVLVKQSLARLPADKTRSKKSREPRPRVKKLKYHQYIPPDQKQELSEVQMDSSYARLLQQQQQFLQLQILSQQQQYSYQTNRPALIQSTSEAQTSCSTVVLRGNSQSAPAQLHPAMTNHKPDHLPANLDEMKVAELKMELKLRSLPVSGTKTDLIERLRLFHDSLNIQSVVATETTKAESVKSTPPVSVIASKVSNLGINDNNMSPPQGASGGESPTQKKSSDKDSEKDKRLHEKERQIEELMRKLEQEQKLVEELKMQLEVEKRSLQLSPLVPIQIKTESRTLSSCSVSCSSPTLLVKQEKSADRNHSSTNPFIICHQPVRARAQVLSSGPADGGELLHSATAPGHVQTSGTMPPKTQASAALQQQCSTQTKQLKNKTKFTNQVTKTKDPPRYEDAVKQTRSMLAAVQGTTPASQHMDDLFDVLIESGEISPFIRQEPPSLDKPLPVTASVTTLPINTVLSRPPPLVQVAQPPGSSLTGLTSNTQLETLLDSTLDAEPQKLKLMEELSSPMEEHLNECTSPSGPNLENSNIDNMDWLDLTLSAPAEGVNPLDMSIPVGVFSPDFLDSHGLHMNWD